MGRGLPVFEGMCVHVCVSREAWCDTYREAHADITHEEQHGALNDNQV